MNKLFLAGAFALLLSTALSAQKTDFSGNWNFKEQSSISGNLYSNGSPKAIRILQKKNEITFERTSAGADGKDFTATESLSFKGEPFETKSTSGKKKVIVLKWNNDTQFTVIANLYDAADESKLVFTYTDKYSLENGDLIFIRKADNLGNGEIWESKAVYTK